MELRRPLTAAAACATLAAVMFVPSASASDDRPGPPASETAPRPAPVDDPAPAAPDVNLADTGSIDTEPYVWGGTAFIAVGGALVLFARRRQLLAPAGDLPAG